MNDIDAELVALIRQGEFEGLRDALLHLSPQTIAATFCLMRSDDQVLGFRILPRRNSGEKIAPASVGYFFDVGGKDGNRTHVNGFAGRCITPLLPRLGK